MGKLCESWLLCMCIKPPSSEDLFDEDIQGVLNTYFASPSGAHPTPVDLLVTGTVPAGSGLSSSAAMVVASTLAFLAVNEKVHFPEPTYVGCILIPFPAGTQSIWSGSTNFEE